MKEDGYDFHVVLGIEVRSNGQVKASESANCRRMDLQKTGIKIRWEYDLF